MKSVGAIVISLFGFFPSLDAATADVSKLGIDATENFNQFCKSADSIEWGLCAGYYKGFWMGYMLGVRDTLTREKPDYTSQYLFEYYHDLKDPPCTPREMDNLERLDDLSRYIDYHPEEWETPTGWTILNYSRSRSRCE